MPIPRASKLIPRASALCCAAILSLATPSLAETRALKLHIVHSKQSAEITFKRDGKYDRKGLEKINRMLGDWRRNEAVSIDPKLLDLVWEVYRESGSRAYIHVVSGYRSKATNDMLRSRSRNVARNSQHMHGRAMDFYLPDVKGSKLREIAMKAGGGGVGYYSRSGFVHLDTGKVRHWPRMSRRQLARLFPDGETMHIPSDGRKMKGYQIALAQWGRKRRGLEPYLPVAVEEPLVQVASLDSSAIPIPVFFARTPIDESPSAPPASEPTLALALAAIETQPRNARPRRIEDSLSIPLPVPAPEAAPILAAALSASEPKQSEENAIASVSIPSPSPSFPGELVRIARERIIPEPKRSESVSLSRFSLRDEDVEKGTALVVSAGLSDSIPPRSVERVVRVHHPANRSAPEDSALRLALRQVSPQRVAMLAEQLIAERIIPTLH